MTATRTHAISSDAQANPELAAELGTLRGSMLSAAERGALPARFTAEPHPDRPAMVFTDHETGRSHTVPIFAYGDARALLVAFFGECPTCALEPEGELCPDCDAKADADNAAIWASAVEG